MSFYVHSNHFLISLILMDIYQAHLRSLSLDIRRLEMSKVSDFLYVHFKKNSLFYLQF